MTPGVGCKGLAVAVMRGGGRPYVTGLEETAGGRFGFCPASSLHLFGWRLAQKEGFGSVRRLEAPSPGHVRAGTATIASRGICQNLRRE